MTESPTGRNVGDREPSKPYRRRKKHEGATWTGEGNALKEDGVWCGAHRQRHGYKSSALGANFERHNGKSYLHWYCKKTGEVLDTIEMGGNSAEGEASGTELDDQSESSVVEHPPD